MREYRNLAGMSVTDAVHETWGALANDEKETVAAACGVSVVTCYQWGEYSDSGEPRLKMPAKAVEAWTRATNDTLVAEVIAFRAGGTFAPLHAKARRVAENIDPNMAVVDELNAVMKELTHSLLDGSYTPDDQRRVANRLQAFLATEARLREQQKAGKPRLRAINGELTPM